MRHCQHFFLKHLLNNKATFLHHLTLERFTTIVPATISYTVLLCWKKRSVMKAGKKKAMEKFLFKARTADLWEETEMVRTERGEAEKNTPEWLKTNNSRWQGHISCWYYKHPVRLNQDRRVAGHNSESHKKLPWSGSSRPPDAHNLEEGWSVTKLLGGLLNISISHWLTS